MELLKEIVKFTSPRDILLVAPNGSRCQRFEAGQTSNVHSSLFDVALAAGLIPEEEMEIAPPPAVTKPVSEATVTAGLIDAVKKLIIRANPADFTMVGNPRSSAVKKLVDFNFTVKEVERAFEQAMHEVNQDVDSSTEHSEPSSVSA